MLGELSQETCRETESCVEILRENWSEGKMIEQRENRLYSFLELNISHQLAPTILVICFSTIRHLFLRISLQAKSVPWQLIYDSWSVTDLLRLDVSQRVKCGGRDLMGLSQFQANWGFSKINIQSILTDLYLYALSHLIYLSWPWKRKCILETL